MAHSPEHMGAGSKNPLPHARLSHAHRASARVRQSVAPEFVLGFDEHQFRRKKFARWTRLSARALAELQPSISVG
jgi:hypothetical protein